MKSGKNELQTLSEQIQMNSISELTGVIGKLHDEIVSTAFIKSAIPEHVFRTLFLDYLLNPALLEQNNVIKCKWIELANGPYNEVDVIGVDETILFTVPPIYKKPEINQAIINNKNFSSMQAMYMMQTNRLAIEGKRFLNAELGSLASAITETVDNTIERWHYIHNYYYGQKVVAKEIAKPKLSNDDFIYD